VEEAERGVGEVEREVGEARREVGDGERGADGRGRAGGEREREGRERAPVPVIEERFTVQAPPEVVWDFLLEDRMMVVLFKCF
jgi:hypothetical protein